MTPQTPKTPPAGTPDWRSPIFRLLVCATLAVPGLAVAVVAPSAGAADMSAAARLMDQAAGGTPPRR